MKLGAFSVSLAVKDIQKSFEFYQSLGFEKFHGEIEQGWLILANGTTRIGLFQGMFDKNMMTFNPGWDENAQPITGCPDVRDIQKKLKGDGVSIMNEADETTTGPASFMVVDPDGNPILLDQHI
jgi:predicted enzyme related to lactoylglutathione lyase